MRLVELAQRGWHVAFTGKAAVPATMPEEQFVDELRYGDVFKFGGQFLMSDQVQINGFKKVGDNFVFDVSVKGTIRLPADLPETDLFKMWPTVFNSKINVSNMDVKPFHSMKAEPWE